MWAPWRGGSIKAWTTTAMFSVATLDHGQDMLVAVAIGADRRPSGACVADMQTVDLDD